MLDTCDIIIAITGSKCIQRIISRINPRVNIRPLPDQFIKNFIQMDQTNLNVATRGENQGGIRTSSTLAVKQIYEENGDDKNIIDHYTQELITFFKSMGRNIDLGMVCNEYELRTLISTMIFLLYFCRVDHDIPDIHSYNYSSFDRENNQIKKQLDFNLKITDKIQVKIIAVFFNYWKDDCRKNNDQFLKKCKLFVLRSADEIVPYINQDNMNDGGNNEDLKYFCREMKLNNNLRFFLPMIFFELERYKKDLIDERGFFSCRREEYLDMALEEVGLKFDASRKIVPFNTLEEFVNIYNGSEKYRYLRSDATRRHLFENCVAPPRGELYFDFIKYPFSSVDTFINAVIKRLRLKPGNHVGLFRGSRMLGHNSGEYDRDRSLTIDNIANATTQDDLLAMRYFWFSDDIFLEHPGKKSSFHWTINPVGEVVRISERNSRLNLLMAIKIYLIWVRGNKYRSVVTFNADIHGCQNLWFMKAARRTYFGGIGDDIRTMKTSSIYQEYVKYLSKTITADTKRQMEEYLQKRWTEYVGKIARDTSIRVPDRLT